jgi:hypothetical protein
VACPRLVVRPCSGSSTFGPCSRGGQRGWARALSLAGGGLQGRAHTVRWVGGVRPVQARLAAACRAASTPGGGSRWWLVGAAFGQQRFRAAPVLVGADACLTAAGAVGQTPGLLARLVLGACTSSGRQRFGTSGPHHGERRQGLPCIMQVVSGGGQ